MNALAKFVVGLDIGAALGFGNVDCGLQEGLGIDDLIDLALCVIIAEQAGRKASGRCIERGLSGEKSDVFFEREKNVVACGETRAARNDDCDFSRRRQRQTHGAFSGNGVFSVQSDQRADVIQIRAFCIRQEILFCGVIDESALLK